MRQLNRDDCQLISGGGLDIGDMVKFLLGGVIYFSLTPNDLSYRVGLKILIGAGATFGAYTLGHFGGQYSGEAHLGKQILGSAAGAALGCVAGAFAGGLSMKLYGNVTRYVYTLFDDPSEPG